MQISSFQASLSQNLEKFFFCFFEFTVVENILVKSFLDLKFVSLDFYFLRDFVFCCVLDLAGP